MTNNEYLSDYDAIVKTVQLYIDGSKQGNSELMRASEMPSG